MLSFSVTSLEESNKTCHWKEAVFNILNIGCNLIILRKKSCKKVLIWINAYPWHQFELNTWLTLQSHRFPIIQHHVLSILSLSTVTELNSQLQAVLPYFSKLVLNKTVSWPAAGSLHPDLWHRGGTDAWPWLLTAVPTGRPCTTQHVRGEPWT